LWAGPPEQLAREIRHKEEVMAVCDLETFKIAVPPRSRLLGLDLGEKTIGLALSDTLLTVATPMMTLKRGKFTADADKLQEIIEN
jgi:putative Holliday junction resolvase